MTMPDGPLITGIASTVDGSVTVEVTIGGGVRSVRLTRSALDHGADHLARTVLQVAARATALANQRANLTFRRTLGRSTDELLSGLGLSFPPELVADDDAGEQRVMR